METEKGRRAMKKNVYLVYTLKRNVPRFFRVVLSDDVLDPEQIKKDMGTLYPNLIFAVRLVDDADIVYYTNDYD
jgi:hypothetical protein